MATSLTRNLKLRINSNLTADAKYNLERIDLLGTTFLVDTQNSLNLRSEVDINIVPESADIGGSGVGGVVTIGSAAQNITSLNVYANQVNFSDPIGILDNASGGNKYLRIAYKSDINGSTDTTSDRTLSIDPQGADRSLVMEQNLSLLGGFSTSLTTTAATSVILPITGTLATLAGVESLSNKTLVLPFTDIITVDDAVRVRDNGSNYVDIKAPVGLPDDYVITLPDDPGLAGQVLATDGTGVLSWLSVGGVGTVTSIDLSMPSDFSVTGGPITSAGTLSVSYATQSAATVLSGPVSGGAATPTFRSLVNTDLPVASLAPALQGLAESSSTLLVDPSNATLKATPSSSDEILIADSDASGVLKKVSLGSLTTPLGIARFTGTWTTGSSTVITHNLGTQDVQVYIYELDSLEKIDIDSVVHTSINSVTLTASTAPTGLGRRVIVSRA